MTIVKTPVFEALQTLIGVAPSSAEPTVIDLSNVDLTLPIFPAVMRRSMTLAGTDGIFLTAMRNTHGAGATSEQSIINPYRGLDASNAPFPRLVDPRLWDFYVIGAAARIFSGTASNFDNGTLRLRFPTPAMILGIDQAGAALTQANLHVPLAVWDGGVGGDVGTLIREDGETYLPLSMRVREGSALFWDTAASNAVVAELLLICSLSPRTTGQDVVT